MARKSEYSSYVFIKNDLASMGWNTRNPTRSNGGRLYTQQECLDNVEIASGLGRQRPEFVVKIHEDCYWVIEAKVSHSDLSKAHSEALSYAHDINKSKLVQARIITGVAGDDDAGYLLQTSFIHKGGLVEPVTYNGKIITGLLSEEQAKYLVDNDTPHLNELVTDEAFLMSVAERINEEFHRASINKDLRATVMSSVLLSMVSDTLPNFNASPEVFIKDINNRAEDVLINHAKREFSEYIELRLPHEDSARQKYKSAVVKVFFLLRKINIKAAMNGSQDLLGKFYEVFLKYGNGAKDIGIVLTPRHVTEFAAEVLDIKSSDLVYDPACGTGGFLVAAYDRVRRNENSRIEMFKKHRIFGVEQQANVAALAIVNMIFRGDGKNNIINNDCLAVKLTRVIRNEELSAKYVSEEEQRLAVTKVLMNPPFALKREDEQETTFIDHALNQMCANGLLLCVIPVSVMYAGGKELAWRTELLRNHTLECVMSFPNDLFYPQASVESVIIVVKKGVPHAKNKKCLFVRIADDGYFKSKRRRLPHNRVSQLKIFENKVFASIHGGAFEEVEGYLQAKLINFEDASLELIPQKYLDNAELNLDLLKTEMARVQSELVFQEMRGSFR